MTGKMNFEFDHSQATCVTPPNPVWGTENSPPTLDDSRTSFETLIVDVEGYDSSPESLDVEGYGSSPESQLGSHNSSPPLHPETSSETKRFTCLVCGRHLGHKSSLKRHLLNHLGLPRDEYRSQHPCSICAKLLSSRSYLEVHEKIHRGELDFKCDLCDAHFASRNKLNQHLVVHSSSRPYECARCRKRFKSLSGQRRHAMTHSAERKFMCEKCGASFKVADYLHRHMRIHMVHVINPESHPWGQPYDTGVL